MTFSAGRTTSIFMISQPGCARCDHRACEARQTRKLPTSPPFDYRPPQPVRAAQSLRTDTRMPVINGIKMAWFVDALPPLPSFAPDLLVRMYSEPCIRGHRATTCNHARERIMLPVRKPGRPQRLPAYRRRAHPGLYYRHTTQAKVRLRRIPRHGGEAGMPRNAPERPRCGRTGGTPLPARTECQVKTRLRS